MFTRFVATAVLLNLRSIRVLRIPVIYLVSARHINPLTTSVSHHIETSQLICEASQLTVFFMMVNIGR